MEPLVGSIEAGGTKFVCAVGRGPDDLRDEIRFSTGGPQETLARAAEFFVQQQRRHGELAALGIGCFGPIDLDPGSSGYGRISATPKTAWIGTDVVGALRRALELPIVFDTDVNAAALGEWCWGAARGLDTFVYLTFGTGIGGGGMARGRLLHGMVHPEMGHMRVPHDLERDPFPGRCPFHGDCWEGLAAGPALEDRWRTPAENLPSDHPAWELEASYIACGLHNLVCVLSPQRLILGGGVMEQSQLFPLVRAKLRRLLADYVRAPSVAGNLERYVVPPALGKRAGILGGIALARRLLAGPDSPFPRS